MAASAPRRLIFHKPHLGLRVMWNHIMRLAGCLNLHKLDAIKALTAEIRAAHALYAHHGELEDVYWINPLIKKLGSSDSVTDIVSQHHDLEAKMDLLLTLCTELEACDGADTRKVVADKLYNAVCEFIVHNLTHMKYEEDVLTPLIHQHFTASEVDAMIVTMLSKQGDKFVKAAARWDLEAQNYDGRVRYMVRATKKAKGNAAEGKFVDSLWRHLKTVVSKGEFSDIEAAVKAQ